MKKQIPIEDRSCYNCDHRTWKPRKQGKYGYCVKHDKWFKDGQTLDKIKCEDWSFK